MTGPSLMDSLFQRSLEDLIKGLRLHHIPTTTTIQSSPFIAKTMDEIRREIKLTDPQTKTIALQKLTYLHSLYSIDMSWASFHSVELSSSAAFFSKKIAYLAATLSFNPNTTDVILLLTHQLRKDLNSANSHEVSLALQTIYSISTPDLARDLTPELFTLLNSNKNFIKKKAIATVLRVFELYPDSVRVCFKRLVENLENSDAVVVSAVVGVFCELASNEPTSYLPLAPEFYRILVDSRNNWVLIKVLKIFAKLAPLEPRLGKRVVEPICEHLRRTGAKSLAFECVRTIVIGLSEYDSAVKLAVEKIREFLSEDDPNLKFLGLQALAIVAPKHLWAVLENKEVVIKSLSDDDVNIKLEALRLVMTMVSEDNVVEICRVLINYALKSDPEFCNEILGSILATCSGNYYEIITDFDWYVSLIGEMSRIPHCQMGDEIENQLIDIGMRVRDVRSELVRVGRDLLIDPALLRNPFVHRILSAAAWVSGEYVELSRNPVELMEALLQPRTSLLPPSIRAVYIQSALKVLTFCVNSYFFPVDDIASSTSGVTDSVPQMERPETSDSVTSTAIADSDPEDGFNPRSLQESFNDDTVNGSMNMINDHGQASSLLFKMDKFTEESIIALVNFVETILSPLLDTHEVEIQDRVNNVLGLIELIRKELSGSLVQNEGGSKKQEVKAFDVVRLLNEAFSEELGPVALNAQEMVPIPDGLELKENLSDLEAICGDFRIPVPASFSLGKARSLENDVIFGSDRRSEDPVTLSESTSLLTDHRKRHGLYYLPSGEKEKASNDYPPANDLSVRDKGDDGTGDLAKLAEQSLVFKKKSNQAKPRPVVVKLDDGDGMHLAAKKPEKKDDLISGAVRDVLLGNEAVASTSRSTKSDRSSGKRSGKDKSSPSELKQDSSYAEISEFGNTSSRRSKHRKEKSSGSSRKETSEHDQKDKKKSSHHHCRHKSQHRADGTVSVVAQSPVIPDFLL